MKDLSSMTTIASGLTFLEGPRWHNGELWFSDFYTNAVYRVTKDGETVKMLDVPNQPSGLGWLPDGRLLVVSMKDHKILRQEPNGELVVHADIAEYCTGHANDMVVAENGNAYVGNFGFDMMSLAEFATANLVLVKPDGSSQIVAKDLQFPNGMVITPDQKRLIVNESFGNRISQFDILADGTLGERRDFANFGNLGDEKDGMKRAIASTVIADGLTLDAEGAVWVADAFHQRAVRIAEGGEILDEIRTAPEEVFAVALGGDDGKTLFLCVAPDVFEHNRSVERAGRMLAVKVEVAHAGTP